MNENLNPPIPLSNVTQWDELTVNASFSVWVSSNLKSHYSYKILNKVTLKIDRISEDNLTGQFYANKECIESTMRRMGNQIS